MRGALIVFEGGDRCGKTTQCRRILTNLKSQGIPAEFVSFPDRQTATGKVIDDYLTKKIELPDKTVHLLFTANRWELVPKMRKLLKDGTTLIVDRYSYSGVAFSSAKKGIDFDWCKTVECGLPKPDLVFLFKLGMDEIKRRSGWGEERYEHADFQAKVSNCFKKLVDKSYWKEIDANKNIDDLTQELMPYVEKTIQLVKNNPLEELW